MAKRLGENAMSDKERAKRYRNRKKAVPREHEQYKKEERERWQRRKAEGKIKAIADMTRREKKQQRAKWRKANFDSKRRKQGVVLDDTPPATPSSAVTDDDAPGPALVDGRVKAGQMRSRKNRRIASKKLSEAMLDIAKKNRLINKYKVRLFRLKKRGEIPERARVNPGEELTPRKQVGKLLPDGAPSQAVKRKLTYQHAVMADLKKSRAHILAVATIKKYRMRKWAKNELDIDVRSLGSKKHRGNKPLDSWKRNKIQTFFCRDDVSRLTAGKNETITRKGVKEQRRYLLDNVDRLHKKFNESSTFRVARATFYRNKPFYVLKPEVHRRETVQCFRCTNMEFMASSLKTNQIVDTDDLKTLAARVFCAPVGTECLQNECPDCRPKRIDYDENIDFSKRVTWQQWRTEKLDLAERRDNTGPSMVKRVTQKVPVTGTIGELVDDFDSEITGTGGKHVMTYFHQANLLRDLKKKLLTRNEHALFHIDWSENYSCKYTTEVQAIHFGASRGFASIHDGILYVGSETESFASISNSPRHDAVAIWTHMRPVFKWLFEKHPEVNTLHFMSDGPSAQYKSKTNFYLHCTALFSEFPQTKAMTWTFTGASHGKGAVDGVGASLKRSADALVATGIDIPDAKTLFDKLSSRETKVKLFYIPARSIDDTDEDIPLSLGPVKGSMKIHQFFSSQNNTMLHRQLGCFCRFPETCECYGPKEHKFGIVSSTTELTAEPPIPGVEITLDHNDVGKWLLVLYDSEPYIGEVLQYLPREDEVLVKVMNQRGKNLFNWPVIEDCIWYSRENVVTLITGPTKSKKQRHFSLEAQDWFKYCSLLS